MHKGTVGLEEGWDWGLKKCPAQEAPHLFLLHFGHIPACLSIPIHPVSLRKPCCHSSPALPAFPFFLPLPPCLPGFLASSARVYVSWGVPSALRGLKSWQLQLGSSRGAC